MIIKPKKINKTIEIPPSKSFLHRALISALLCKNKVLIKNIYLSEDIKATINGIEAFGKKAKILNDSLIIEGDITNNVLQVNCFDSGSTLRFLIPIALALCEKSEFIFGDSLDKRPLDEYYSIFEKQNIKYEKTKNKLVLKGKIKPGIYELKGNVSSQFVTGLLFALPILNSDSEIIIKEELQSKSYIDISLNVLKSFGIEIENIDYKCFKIKGKQEYIKSEYLCEGDWSTASFWYFLKSKHNIEIKDLNENSIQGDAIVQKLCPNLPKEFNGDNYPDLIPNLVAYAIGTNQEIKITHCNRLKYKECDRLFALNEFKKVGANIFISNNEITVKKSPNLYKGSLKTYNDHRMIMAYVLLSYLGNIEIEIDETEGINKSYPDFFTILGE